MMFRMWNVRQVSTGKGWRDSHKAESDGETSLRTYALPRGGRVYVSQVSQYKERRPTHLQLGHDFEFVTSHRVLATVSVSGHSETSVKRESVSTEDLT